MINANCSVLRFMLKARKTYFVNVANQQVTLYRKNIYRQVLIKKKKFGTVIHIYVNMLKYITLLNLLMIYCTYERY